MTSYIFDDNSLESKVLQHEITDCKVIKVGKEPLDKWLSNINDKDIAKVYLHYCYEDYTPGLRAEIHSELAKNPNLRIICQYENNPRSDVAKKQIKFKAIKHTEIASDTIKPEPLGGHEVPSEDFVKKLQEVHKDKIKTIDYSKYSVGGNDSGREPTAFIPHDDPKPELNKLADKFRNGFKNKRRKKE